jgi:hypothetical protein
VELKGEKVVMEAMADTVQEVLDLDPDELAITAGRAKKLTRQQKP